MTRRWRLVGGKELYDIKADPRQQHDVAADHSEVVAELRAAHEDWWTEITPLLDQYCPISLGNEAENPTRLNAMDVMGDVAWNQVHITMAQKSTGKWAVDVEQPGDYRFSLKRWPEELRVSIDEAISEEEAGTLAPYGGGTTECRTIQPVKARLKVFDREAAAAIEAGDTESEFHLRLEETGVTELEAWFVDETGAEQGAYYVYVERT